MQNKDKGFIALFTVIIVSFVLLIVAVNLGFAGFNQRFNIFYTESKEKSFYLAHSCTEEVRLRLALDKNYPGDESLAIGNESCYVFPTQNNSGDVSVIARAIKNDAYTFLKVIFDTDDPLVPVISFQELPTYP